MALESEPLNAEDVARILHIGKNAVYQLAKTGELASYRIGRKLRFTADDVEAFVAAQRQGSVADAHRQAAAAGTAAPLAAAQSPEGTFMLAGNDMIGDILAHHLNEEGIPVQRSYEGSYRALVQLYLGAADVALTHLWDIRTNSYNIAFVQRVVPGTPVLTIRLVPRKQGFLVARGNPKKLTSWGGLLREGVRLANREIGSGSRILLDSKLIAMEARPEAIEGYEKDYTGGAAVAQAVENGLADVALGNEKLARQFPDLDFVPLQTEWLDLTVRKSERTRDLVHALKDLTGRPAVHAVLGDLGYDTAKTGVIIYES